MLELVPLSDPPSISIHALLAESDRCPCYVPHRIRLISIHALLAESDPNTTRCRVIRSYFYPRSPCGERRIFHVRSFTSKDISIHALLAESDVAFRVFKSNCFSISIHALLAESDIKKPDVSVVEYKFLSTLSLRRATMALALCFYLCWYFYPRSPCGERPRETTSIKPIFGISIHALLAESDELVLSLLEQLRHFYPRSPCGERQ